MGPTGSFPKVKKKFCSEISEGGGGLFQIAWGGYFLYKYKTGSGGNLNTAGSGHAA